MSGLENEEEVVRITKAKKRFFEEIYEDTEVTRDEADYSTIALKRIKIDESASSEITLRRDSQCSENMVNPCSENVLVPTLTVLDSMTEEELKRDRPSIHDLMTRIVPLLDSYNAELELLHEFEGQLESMTKMELKRKLIRQCKQIIAIMDSNTFVMQPTAEVKLRRELDRQCEQLALLIGSIELMDEDDDEEQFINVLRRDFDGMATDENEKEKTTTKSIEKTESVYDTLRASTADLVRIIVENENEETELASPSLKAKKSKLERIIADTEIVMLATTEQQKSSEQKATIEKSTQTEQRTKPKRKVAKRKKTASKKKNTVSKKKKVSKRTATKKSAKKKTANAKSKITTRKTTKTRTNSKSKSVTRKRVMKKRSSKKKN